MPRKRKEEEKVPEPSTQARATNDWKPQTDFFVTTSKDGRFVICKTVITSIKPRTYFEKILEGPIVQTSPESASTENSTHQNVE